jgi:hypothetical protein
MSYTKETIKDQDKLKVNFDVLMPKSWLPKPREWYLSNETASWLIRTGGGTEDDRNGASFLFMWNEKLVCINAEWQEHLANGKRNETWHIRDLMPWPMSEMQFQSFAKGEKQNHIPDNSEQFRRAVFEALSAYSGGMIPVHHVEVIWN